MNHEVYGKAFRNLRIDRGYSLKEAAGNIVTPQMLGVFEKGKSSINLYSFGRLLIRLGATWEDFFRYFEGASISRELSLGEDIQIKIQNNNYYDGLKLLETAFSGNYSDNHQLKEVYQLAYKSFFNTLHLTSKLTTEELNRILAYLNRIDTWGRFEYAILNYVISDCPYEMVKYRAEKLIYAIMHDKPSFLRTKKEDVNALINIIGYFSSNAYYSDADYFLNHLEKALEKPTYHRMFNEKLNLKFYQAMNLLRQDDPKGLDIARDCIHFLEAYEALDDSTVAAIDKNRIYRAVSALNKTGIPFKVN